MPDLPEIPSSPEELVAAAKRLRLEASVLAAQAGAKLNQAEAYEALAGVKSRAETSPLNIAHDAGTLGAPMHVESAGAKRSAGQFTEEQAKHGFVAVLIRLGKTVADAKALLEEKLKRTFSEAAIRSWYKDPDDRDFRAPPEDAVRVLKAEWNVPVSAWARVKAAPKG